MSAIRGRNTAPERSVRSLVHSMGYRYRLHANDLPGKPDLVFRSRRKVIFVHGCFWHRHECPQGQVRCQTNAGFWQRKFEENVRRDGRILDELRARGWDVLVVWECWLRDPERLRLRILRFLENAEAVQARAWRRA